MTPLRGLRTAGAQQEDPELCKGDRVQVEEMRLAFWKTLKFAAEPRLQGVSEHGLWDRVQRLTVVRKLERYVDQAIG